MTAFVDVKTIFFFSFNFIMQIVLLNLLIALMGEARAEAATEASLNAFRRRAELVLEQEQLLRKSKTTKRGRGLSQARRRALLSARWLHVLVPDEHGWSA